MVRGIRRSDLLQSRRVLLGACGMALAPLRSIAASQADSALEGAPVLCKGGRVEGTGPAPMAPLGTVAAVGSPKGPQLPSCTVAVNTPGPRMCVRVSPHVPALLALPCPEPSLCPQTCPRVGGAGTTAPPGPAPHGCSPCGGWSILSRAIGLVAPGDRGVAPSGCCSAPPRAAWCPFARCRGSQPWGWDGTGRDGTGLGAVALQHPPKAVTRLCLAAQP